ncbi:MAG: nucleotide exchange factor GrpE [Patescibacteria group bacterium]|nr:nucleotide exchange factor GrpE [Patescibacteria group bacterium]
MSDKSKKNEENKELEDVVFESEESSSPMTHRRGGKEESLGNRNNEDFVIEDETETTNSFGDKTTKDLREKLKKVITEKQEYLEGWQRARADAVNAKRNFEEEKSKLLKFAKADLITQIIPVLDSFEMAFNNEEIDSKDEWSVGIKNIYFQLLGILKENGVEQISPLDEEFSPISQNSVEIIDVEKEEDDGIVKEVVQRGYSLNGEIIRSAKVKVGEFKNKDIKT